MEATTCSSGNDGGGRRLCLAGKRRRGWIVFDVLCSVCAFEFCVCVGVQPKLEEPRAAGGGGCGW